MTRLLRHGVRDAVEGVARFKKLSSWFDNASLSLCFAVVLFWTLCAALYYISSQVTRYLITGRGYEPTLLEPP